MLMLVYFFCSVADVIRLLIVNTMLLPSADARKKAAYGAARLPCVCVSVLLISSLPINSAQFFFFAFCSIFFPLHNTIYRLEVAEKRPIGGKVESFTVCLYYFHFALNNVVEVNCQSHTVLLKVYTGIIRIYIYFLLLRPFSSVQSEVTWRCNASNREPTPLTAIITIESLAAAE